MTIIQCNYDKAIKYLNATVKSYFEFVFPYVERSERFREIDRFLWESKQCLRFQNEYVGDVVIEISAWNDKAPCAFNEYFDAFMYFLKSREDKLRPQFFVSGECSVTLFEQLSRHFELVILDPDKGVVPLSDNKVAIGFRNRGE